ncbi:MAG: FG-GAP repeat domain-containing protein, partial [Dolichospermum sp.]
MNNDNKPEIVSVNVSSNGIRIYQNQTVVGSLTTSSFATPFFLPTGTGPVYVGISDIDSDNKPDLVTSNYTSANITVHRNIHNTGSLSTSSFAAGSNFSSGAGANSVALSDLNADGKPDFVITNQNSQNTSIFPNGTPSEITTRPSVSPVGSLDLCVTPQVTLEASVADNYLWSTGETTRTITVRNPGVYFVRVRRNGSCISDRSEAGVIRVLGERTLTISANRPTNFCNGDSVILTANELSGYIWNTGETTRSITVRTSGSYSVRRIANNCTSGVSNTIAVNVTQGEANVNVLSGRTLLCFGETTTLEAPIAQGYLWSNGATSRSITVGTTGSYSVRVINGICTSNISTPVEVIVSGQIPLPTITSDRTSICANDSVLLTASVAFRYRWSTGDTTRSIWVRNQGNYAVRHISAQGCSSDLSQPINISLINIPTPTISAVRTQICEGEAASITCSNANALNCIWSNGATSSTITPNASGIYTVRLVSSGCTSEVSNPIEIIVSPLPPQAVITPNRAVNAICEGDSIILTATNSAGYLWSNGANTQNIRVKQAGNYTVKLISVIGCEGPLSEAFNLVVNPKPSLAVGLDRPSPSICENDSVTLTAADGLTYLWSTGETTRSIVVKTTQQIGLTVSNGQCTNASSSLVSVSLNPRPNPVTLTLNGDLEICDGDSVQLSATVSSGGYIWNT